jgi:hypothetical protein
VVNPRFTPSLVLSSLFFCLLFILLPSFEVSYNTMLDLKTFIAASAAAALFAGARASELVVRNGEPAKPACTTPFQPFVYAGCFSDPSSPQGLLYTSGLPTQNMTVEICVAFCKGMCLLLLRIK